MDKYLQPCNTYQLIVLVSTDQQCSQKGKDFTLPFYPEDLYCSTDNLCLSIINPASIPLAAWFHLISTAVVFTLINHIVNNHNNQNWCH